MIAGGGSGCGVARAGSSRVRFAAAGLGITSDAATAGVTVMASDAVGRVTGLLLEENGVTEMPAVVFAGDVCLSNAPRVLMPTTRPTAPMRPTRAKVPAKGIFD